MTSSEKPKGPYHNARVLADLAPSMKQGWLGEELEDQQRYPYEVLRTMGYQIRKLREQTQRLLKDKSDPAPKAGRQRELTRYSEAESAIFCEMQKRESKN